MSWILSGSHKNSLAYLRAIQGHSGGTPIMPELMGYTSAPHNWKECTFHRGCSWSVQSILEERTDSGWKSTASSLLYNTELFSWKSRWRTPWWFRSSSESALSQSLETASRCRLLDKIVQNTRFGIANLANKVICDHHPQSCARRLHLQSNLWERRRSSIVRNTLNPKASTQSYAEKRVACAAAAGAFLQWSCK